ncbi:MAG: serine hydrolase domain-containing protein [Lacipirellulaceae bacterium]
MRALRERFGVVLLVVAGSAASVVRGGPVDADQWFRSRVEAAREATGVPGLVVALVDANQVVTAASGLRAAAPAEVSPILTSDPVHIGSNFKAMTATVVARIVERGLLRWDTSLGELYPELSASPQAAAITIEQLLTHRGGLDDQQADSLLSGLSIAESPRAARTAALPVLVAATPARPAGEFHYANVGYGLAGAMLERVLDRDFDQILAEELATPLGITSLALGAPGGEDLQEVIGPLGHDPGGVPATPREQAVLAALGIDPAGNYQVTIEDWAKFARLHLNVLAGAEGVLSRQLVERLQTPVGPPVADLLGASYALGWVVGDGPTLTHSGSNGFWGSYAVLNVSGGRALLLAGTQTDPALAAADELAQDPVIREWLRSGGVIPEPGAALLAIVALAGRVRIRAAA